MSTHKRIDLICIAAAVLAVAVTLLFINGEALGIVVNSFTAGYESRLFDDSRVHTIDIVMDDWDEFISGCEDEEYVLCSVVIDGESIKNAGIRAKGNTSLTQVSSLGSERYSFKLEFDHYDSTKSYHGLDKISLNNIIQDNTYMKDYLCYKLMAEFGVAAPLCSYVKISVNGEYWGLYLAVEGVEESFLQRNYGSNYGELYKPDSMSFGGGRGNGRGFDMEDFDPDNFSMDAFANTNPSENADNNPTNFPQFDNKQQPDGADMDNPPELPNKDSFGQMPDGFNMDDLPDLPDKDSSSDQMPNMGNMADPPDGFGGDMKNFEFPEDMPSISDIQPGGMGSSDVKLQYIDDDPESYSNIFDNAKTDITDSDMQRLISSLKSLSAYSDLEDVLDIDAVLRYFVVHSFVCNEDSYTGSMIHNYYLYEQDGKLSMIPWDYNLAFGGFTGGSDATSTVNDPIDDMLSDRPMQAWIFSSEEYTDLYHEYYAKFIADIADSGYLSELISSTTALISPYVESDPTSFCSYDEFLTASAVISEFCALRAESVSGQLNGTVASTSSAQSADSSGLVDASSISITAMGSMNIGGSGSAGLPAMNDFPEDMPHQPDGTNPFSSESKGQQPDERPQQNNGKIPISDNQNDQQKRAPEVENTFRSGDSETIILLSASALALAAGFTFTILYKRRRDI